MNYSIANSRQRELNTMVLERVPRLVSCTGKECGVVATYCVGVECYNITEK
jgi:hypothetical protein